MRESEEAATELREPDLQQQAEADLSEAETADDKKRLDALEGIHDKLSRALEGEEDQAGSPRQ